MSIFAAGTWAAIGTVGGLATSIYGADQQRKANNRAIDANKAAVDESNKLEWAKYLMSRGVDPTGAQTGAIPTDAKAINTKLPFYATGRRPVVRSTVSAAPRTGGPDQYGRSWGGLGL